MGWKNRSLLQGNLNGKQVKLSPASGNRKYLAGPAEQFSATRQFPPQGHQSYEGSIKEGQLTVKRDAKEHILLKTIRMSPTLNKNLLKKPSFFSMDPIKKIGKAAVSMSLQSY